MADDYTIYCQQNPLHSTIKHYSQSGFFFNDPEHIVQQANVPFYVLTALNQRNGKTDARCVFFIDGNRAISPAAAPFGSIEFIENLPDSVLDTFLQTLLEITQLTPCTTLRLVHYPFCYAPEQTKRLLKKLQQLGFCIRQTNQTYYLPVSASPFTNKLVPAERRRLGKCQRSGFLFQQWTSPNIENVVRSILEVWQQKDYSLRIGHDKLSRLLHQFPERFLIFRVSDENDIGALAITIRVSPNILYVFLPVTFPEYQNFSPMVMLIDGLYTYCQQQRINLLDLGVSLDGNGQLKPSLARFKQNLGAQESPKFVFEKQF